MSNTTDIILSGLAATGAGKEVTSDNVSVLDGDGHHVSSASPESEDSVQSENSTVDDLLLGEDTPSDSSNKASPSADGKSKTSANKEVITVTDDKGRRKIEIDYSNKEAIKKAFSHAAGARKWQAERDQALKQLQEKAAALSEKERDWGTLEGAFKQGPEALFDLVLGRKGAFQERVSKEIQKAEFLKNASPEEIKSLEAREQAERSTRELERIRKENEEFRKQMAEERESSETRALESQVNPVFDKYRFAEKLGNPDDEHMFDDMLWSSALKRLQPYEEKGLLTPETIEREFRAVAQAIRKRIGGLAEKKASQVMDQKKQEATENVQAKVMSGYRTGGNAKEARDLIQSGNLTGLLKGWGKYGSLFNK